MKKYGYTDDGNQIVPPDGFEIIPEGTMIDRPCHFHGTVDKDGNVIKVSNVFHYAPAKVIGNIRAFIQPINNT